MYCRKCGTSLNENWQVCPQCGAPVEKEDSSQPAPSYPQNSPITTYQGSLGNPTPVLVWGIVGLACSASFFLSVLGIIFSLVGMKKAKNYNEFTGYASSQKAVIGRRLSIAGLIVGIVMTVLLIVYIIVLANLASGSYSYYRYPY